MYKLSFGGLVLRTLFFLGIFIAIMIGCILLGVIVAIFFKDSALTQQILESQKSAIEAQKAVMDSIPK